MNHEMDPPLSPQERAVAEALANLPALEPTPELDARVLANARAALGSKVQPSHRSRLRWFSASLGSAAVAVLAAGIAWQGGFFGLNQGTSETSQAVPGTSSFEDPSPLLRETPAPMAVSTPPPAPSPTTPKQSSDAAHHPATALEREPQLDTSRTSKQSTPPTSAEVDAIRQNQARSRQQAVPSPARTAPAPAPMPEPRADPRNETTTTTAGHVADESVVPVDWRDDAKLAPDAWLDRIRARLHQDDPEGARASLQKFVEDHSELIVPDDLTGLLEK